MKKRQTSTVVIKVIAGLIFGLFIISILYPLVLTLMISVKTPADFTINPTGPPARFYWQNYVAAWSKGNFSLLMINSVIVTAATVILTILLASPAGFVLAKANLKGGKLIFYYFILGMIVPVQVLMIPLLKMGQALGIYNTLAFLVLIFTATGMAFPLMIYTSFYKALPGDILEAARIDGCNTVNLFLKIIFPLTTAVNATVAIIAGMFPWKDFFIPLVFSSREEVRTLTIGLFKFSGNYYTEWTTVFAAIVIQSLPLILLYLLIQKTFISGVTSGAVKG